MVQDMLGQTNKLKMQDKGASRTRQRCKTCCGHDKSSTCKTKEIKVQDQGASKQCTKKYKTNSKSKAQELT